MADTKVTVTITRNGPYLVKGGAPLSRFVIGDDGAGNSEEWVEGEKIPAQANYALCRCGQSANKPFCDGTHTKKGFDGTETADRAPYVEQADAIDGPDVTMSDAEKLCAFARFCDPNGKVWNQVEKSDDPKIREMLIRQVNACPSGRLVAWDKKTGTAIEQRLPVSIGLIEDPVEKCAGPIWLRGGIALIGADGFEYEEHNRMTLCRCGASKNKPFCDGSHASIHFTDK
jgi:CDGSH-type Zn-finger protein